MDVERLPGRPHRFEIVPRVVPQTEFQALSGRGLLDHLGVPFELVANCGTDEIRAVRVEPLLYHQIDTAQVDVAEIHRNLLGIPRLGSQFLHIAGHPMTLQPTSSCHPTGWYMGWGAGLSRERRSCPYRKSNPNISMVQSTEKWPWQDAASANRGLCTPGSHVVGAG